MLDHIEFVKPDEIEARSMAIITRELGTRTWPEPELSIVKRCIHTSADFDYADQLFFSENAGATGIQAIRQGAWIVTDTMMAASGINKKRLGAFGGQVRCFMSDEDVAAEAASRGITRSAVCMERGAAIEGPVIFAIGNAPTALIRLYELIREGAVPARTDHWCPGRLCQCGGISERTDDSSESGNGGCVHCCQRAQRWKQYSCGNLQCIDLFCKIE